MLPPTTPPKKTAPSRRKASRLLLSLAAIVTLTGLMTATALVSQPQDTRQQASGRSCRTEGDGCIQTTKDVVAENQCCSGYHAKSCSISTGEVGTICEINPTCNSKSVAQCKFAPKGSFCMVGDDKNGSCSAVGIDKDQCACILLVPQPAPNDRLPCDTVHSSNSCKGELSFDPCKGNPSSKCVQKGVSEESGLAICHCEGTTSNPPPPPAGGGTGGTGGGCAGTCIGTPAYMENCGVVGRPEGSGTCTNPAERCCGEITSAPPPPPPAPSCTVDLFLRVNGQNVAPDKDNHFYLDYKEPFTLRGRVTNIENGRVDFLRFVALENQIFTPAAQLDMDAPYEATFTAVALGSGKIRANVRYEGKDDPICSDEVVIRSKGSCNDICTVDNDCRVAQGLRCLAAGEGVNRCRKPEYPSSETCGEEPAGPGVCLGIDLTNQTRPNNPPAPGDMIKLYCSRVAGADRYRFRITQPDGVVRDLSHNEPNSVASLPYVVPSNMVGRFIGQCSVCLSVDDSSCSAWESL